MRLLSSIAIALALLALVARAGAQPKGADAGAPAEPAEERIVGEGLVGRPAPPTEAATRTDAQVRAGLEVFAQYSYRNTGGPGDNRTWFHVFDVPRVHGAIEGSWERARGRVVIEAVRSASEGALLGVAGDSLVLRVREGYGAYRPIDALEIAAGVVPTLTVPELDGTWMLRAVAPSGLESSGLASPADLGARASFELPAGHGRLSAGAFNGEGYASRELNRGKNLEGAAEIHPLASGALRPLGVFGSYTSGSTGTTLARADRATGGLVWQDARVRGGAFFTYAWGVAQLGTQRAIVASAFVRVEPVRRVLLGARADHVVRDVGGEPRDALTTLWIAGGYRLADPLETFLALTRAIPTTRAQNELPGSNLWELRLIGRVIF